MQFKTFNVLFDLIDVFIDSSCIDAKFLLPILGELLSEDQRLIEALLEAVLVFRDRIQFDLLISLDSPLRLIEVSAVDPWTAALSLKIGVELTIWDKECVHSLSPGSKWPTVVNYTVKMNLPEIDSHRATIGINTTIWTIWANICESKDARQIVYDYERPVSTMWNRQRLIKKSTNTWCRLGHSASRGWCNPPSLCLCRTGTMIP